MTQVVEEPGGIVVIKEPQASRVIEVSSPGPKGDSGDISAVTGTEPIQVANPTTAPVISINPATSSAAGSMSAADKNKLNGVATGATANSSDAILLDRANHTGTQLAATISNFAASVLATVLAGLYLATGTAITAADTVLSALGKLQKQITDLIAVVSEKASAGANNDITEANALASINTGQVAGLRNAVINGNGLVQQRAAPTLTAAPQYGAADRHLVGVTSGTSVSGTVGVLSNSGFSCGVGYGAIAASWTAGQFIHKHRIESANTGQFNSKTVTVSGRLYQDTGGARNFTVSLGKPTTTADTFSAVTNLGTSSAVAVASGVVTPFSFTLLMGSADASLGLEVSVTDSSANTVVNKNYAVSDLQLEIGSVATVLEQRPIGLERALCQRYCNIYGGNSASDALGVGQIDGGGTAVNVPMFFPVTMRAAPTLTYAGALSGFTFNLGGSGGTPSSVTIGLASPYMANVVYAISGGTAGYSANIYTSSVNNKLIFSAEL